jgi:hypothetical protein
MEHAIRFIHPSRELIDEIAGSGSSIGSGKGKILQNELLLSVLHPPTSRADLEVSGAIGGLEGLD